MTFQHTEYLMKYKAKYLTLCSIS